jgi:hypothetical protein
MISSTLLQPVAVAWLLSLASLASACYLSFVVISIHFEREWRKTPKTSALLMAERAGFKLRRVEDRKERSA